MSRDHRALAEENLTKAHNHVQHVEACRGRGEPSDEGAEAAAIARSGMAVAHALLASEPSPLAVAKRVCACGHDAIDHGLAGGGAPAGSLGGCKWCTCTGFHKPFPPQPFPIVPVPGVPARGVLTAGQRVLAVPTEGHIWPEILRSGMGLASETRAGAVESVDENDDLVRVVLDGLSGRGRGSTVQLHREQLRIPAPPGPPDPPDVPEMVG